MPGGHVTRSERDTIARMHSAGHADAEIARTLGRARTTIWRELRRNADPDGRYDPCRAQRRAGERRAVANRSRGTKLGRGRLRGHVRRRLGSTWSPEQIAGRLPLEHPGDPRMRVSHETIYRHVREDRESGGTLWKRLRRSRRRNRKRYGGGRDGRGRIRDRVGIEQRPAEVESRSRLGDWEGDTVVGSRQRGCVAVQVERRSRYVVAAVTGDRRSGSVNAGLASAIRHVPRRLRRTLTLDNGKEFAGHVALRRLGWTVYFANPYSSWERGTCENTNGLLREFLPKGESLLGLSSERLAGYVRLLNNRPRKCLGYRTPREVLFEIERPAS
jgi:IS30 family transposase